MKTKIIAFALALAFAATGSLRAQEKTQEEIAAMREKLKDLRIEQQRLNALVRSRDRYIRMLGAKKKIEAQVPKAVEQMKPKLEALAAAAGVVAQACAELADALEREAEKDTIRELWQKVRLADIEFKCAGRVVKDARELLKLGAELRRYNIQFDEAALERAATLSSEIIENSRELDRLTVTRNAGEIERRKLVGELQAKVKAEKKIRGIKEKGRPRKRKPRKKGGPKARQKKGETPFEFGD